MPRTFTDEDLGLDMHMIVKTCDVCRKQSDAAIVFQQKGERFTMCGTHYDEFRILTIATKESAAEFVTRLRQGKYRPCWEARLED